jgi:sugar/nucleoside kinase (ribokinase family)
MKKQFDVLGLGCTAVDDILYVPSYPAADGKVQVRHRERHCGGLCATALVAAARLGARCVFAGTLGEDDDSQFVLETLRRERVDVRHRVSRPDAAPVRSVIVVDESRRTRNIFYHVPPCPGADSKLPGAGLIRKARVLLVDRFGIPGMIRAARIARSEGIPVVADFESFKLLRFGELLALADHLIVSETFACQFTGVRSAAVAVKKLWAQDRAVVVVTAGAEGCWYLDNENSPVRHLPAFRVKALDTTGCGDVFHGAYAMALARGLPLLERLRFASAAAALKTMKRGGQAGIPDKREVARFLARRT